jgi:hypothetical protein
MIKGREDDPVVASETSPIFSSDFIPGLVFANDNRLSPPAGVMNMPCEGPSGGPIIIVELELAAGLGFCFCLDRRRAGGGGVRYVSSSISNPSCRIGWLTVDVRDWGVIENRRSVLDRAIVVDAEVEVEAEVDGRGIMNKSVRDPSGT